LRIGKVKRMTRAVVNDETKEAYGGVPCVEAALVSMHLLLHG